MDPDSTRLQAALIAYNPETSFGNMWLLIVLFFVILFVNALISAAKAAFPDLTEKDLKDLDRLQPEKAKIIAELYKKPKKLGASILIATTFLNITLIILGDYIIRSLLGPSTVYNIGSWIDMSNPTDTGNVIVMIISVLIITFMLALFGTIMPERHASFHKLRIISIMAKPLRLLNTLCYPMNALLLKFSNTTETRLNYTHNVTLTSKEDIDTAIDLAVTNQSESSVQEAGILKGIVSFGDTAAKQIMRSRMDIVGVDISSSYDEVLHIVKDSGYSRLPVYEEDLDHIKGILYVKDLLAFTDESKDFLWQNLIRNAVFFVPESKKIDELLREFQSKRMHMAIIVDEYGGTTGIATLEDIMEEVVGDIKDEFDIGEDTDFIKLDDNHYVFEGKTLLNDVCRVIGQSTNYFDEVRGEADSIGGLILEITGMIPASSQEITIENLKLMVISATKRRIEKVSLQIYEN